MTTTLKLWFESLKATLTNARALAVFAVIYAILLATFFRFIWIREGTVWQVLFTYLFMILIPAEFFIFQAAIIDRMSEQRFRWRMILVDAIKFFIATIPVLLVAWFIYCLLNKAAVRYPAPASALPLTGSPPKPAQLHWPSLLFATLKFVLWGVATPLVAIHLWIAIRRNGARSSFERSAKSRFQRIGSALARAFASESVLVYGLGLIVFFVLPYLILVPAFTLKGNKTEFAVFALRLLLVFVLSLIGWVVTLTTLVRANADVEAIQLTAPATVAESPA